MNAILIFFYKAIENILSTIRIICISKRQKVIGAILNGLIGLVWVLSTCIIVKNIKDDLLNIISFCLGCAAGSFIGSIIEEKVSKKEVQ